MPVQEAVGRERHAGAATLIDDDAEFVDQVRMGRPARRNEIAGLPHVLRLIQPTTASSHSHISARSVGSVMVARSHARGNWSSSPRSATSAGFFEHCDARDTGVRHERRAADVSARHDQRQGRSR